ncbi:MAG: hypothetical protein M3P10_01335 [Actinomycetota bacterium]|nr:hypothetical protein [Actinomycetota bacterium]
MAPPRATARLFCLIGVLVTSCTGAAPPPPSHPPPPLPGELLSVTSDQTASSLVRYRPADASSATIDSPIDPEAVNRSTVAGVSTAEGSLFVAVNTRTLQAYALPAGTTQVEELGPALGVRARQEPSVQISEVGAVVATCDEVQVLPLPAADGWRSLGPGCWAALDPSGSRVAVVSAGGHVLLHELEGGGTPSLLFDLSDLAAALGTDVPAQLIGVPSWGPQGLAFFVRAGDQLGVFVREDSGTLVEVLQERYTNVYRVPRLAWQPGGTMLAISDDVGPNPAVLRVFDTATGDLRALSMFPVGYAGMQWAPDGSSLAVLTGTGVLLAVDLDGAWLLHRQTDWRELLAWQAAS